MIYMFLAEGLEEIEALCPLDLMRRAGLEVTTVGIGGEYITGAHSITIRADITDKEFLAHAATNSPEMIFLPGGMPGTLNLEASEVVCDAIRSAAEDKKYIAAICAAPSIPGKMGLLVGKEAVCYPGFENYLKGAVISEKRVVLDGNILTAAGMGAALDMGIEIVKLFCGADKASVLRSAVIAD